MQTIDTPHTQSTHLLREEEARTLLTSNQDELVRRYAMVCSLYEDDLADRSVLEEEDQQLREANAEQFEELTKQATYIAELEQKLTTTTAAAIGMIHEIAEPSTCTHCQELEQVLKQEQMAHAELERRYADLDARHTDLYIKWANRQEWRAHLLTNETISNPSCKLVAAHLWENGLESTDGELQFFKEDIATHLGCNPDTVANAIKRLRDYDVINVRTKDIILPDGTKHKDAETYISRNTLKDPTSIRMEKKQGAAKPKVCFRDGTLLHNYTVRHCPTHGEIGLYGQPGLPREANELLMVDDFIRKYQNRVPRALSDYRDPFTGELISATSTNDKTPIIEEKKPSFTASTAIGDSTATIVDAQPDTIPSDNIISISDKKRTSEEKKPSPTASTAHADTQLAPVPSNDITRNNEEKKPSSTALTPSIDEEEDRWAAAEKILTELNDHGLVLTYKGGRRLIETSTIKPSEAQIQDLAERIKHYEIEIRTYLDMQADYDQQEAIQILNATLPEDQQIPMKQEIAQPPSTPESKGSLPEPPTVGLGAPCEICRYNEAIYIWKAGKRYCQACYEQRQVSAQRIPLPCTERFAEEARHG